MSIFKNDDIIMMVALNVDIMTLRNMYFVNSTFYGVLNNNYFWKLKYVKDYNYYDDIIQWKEAYMSIGDIFFCGYNKNEWLGINQLHITIPTKIGKAEHVSCGPDFILTLYNDKTTLFGNIYGYEQQDIPANVKYFEAGDGYGHAIFVNKDNGICAVGKDNYGQLGFFNRNNHGKGIIPLNVNVKSIACHDHTLILDTDGNIWSFGMNNYLQLGRHTNDDNKCSKPTKVNVPKTIAVACGINHSLLIDEHNNLWGFGRNTFGQLGLDNYRDDYAPTSIGLKAKLIACGLRYSVFTDMKDEVWVMGYDMTQCYKPTCLNMKAKVIACGKNHTLFIDMENNVWGYGRNNGQLGVGQLDIADYVNIPRSLNMKARNVYCGGHHSVILI